MTLHLSILSEIESLNQRRTQLHSLSIKYHDYLADYHKPQTISIMGLKHRDLEDINQHRAWPVQYQLREVVILFQHVEVNGTACVRELRIDRGLKEQLRMCLSHEVDTFVFGLIQTSFACNYQGEVQGDVNCDRDYRSGGDDQEMLLGHV